MKSWSNQDRHLHGRVQALRTDERAIVLCTLHPLLGGGARDDARHQGEQ